MSSGLVAEIRAELGKLADPERAMRRRRFFKETIRNLGLRASQSEEVAGEFFSRLKGNLPQALEVAGELMRSGVVEEASVGIRLVRRFKQRLTREHFDVFDGWIDHLTNWANTDFLCRDLIAETVEKDPSLVKRLLSWTRSENRWRRRAAAVSLVPIVVRGEMLDEAFSIADKLIFDGDEMVQKGVGWLLKDVSFKHPGEVKRYLLRWKERAPALVLRYASGRLPKNERVLKTR